MSIDQETTESQDQTKAQTTHQAEQTLSPRGKAFLDLYSMYLSIPEPASHYTPFGYNAWKRK